MRALKTLMWVVAASLSISAHAAITQTQLAGQNLSQYPYFQYVRSFHFPSPPRVAIDPTRFPAIVGQTCDIYIVDHKSPALWATDPTLVDLTPGGALTHTFVAGTIQANSVAVVPTLVLNDDAGADLGVPYDVVLDCNQDGLLDGDDYIDGLGDEAGFYMVTDTVMPGPYATATLSYNLSTSVAATYGINPAYRSETAWFPSTIGLLEKLPLVVISDAKDYKPKDYVYLARHLASWGYVVLIHANETGPGPVTAAGTTLRHTDAFIDQASAGAIVRGLLKGHLDTSRIGWIGHGRGGEGVVIAYHALFTGSYVPVNYSIKGIRFVDSMAPTDFWWTDGTGKPGFTQPHAANYHLWAPAAELVISGDPADPTMQSQPIADRATRYKQVSSLHGASAAQFANAPTFPPAAGPCQLHTSEVHEIVLGYELPMLKHYLDGNLPSLDYLTRQYEFFHPLGIDVDLCIEVQNEYRNGSPTGNRVIDDYQANASTLTSSSGGPVSYDVDNVTEGRLDDVDNTFVYSPADAFNGAIFATSVDKSRGVTFEWKDVDRFYEWQLKDDAMRNFSPYLYLSLRGAQGSRHPDTTWALGDLTFQVELRDGAGHTSAISIGAYGGGLEDPYQRAGGWFDAMETLRFRLTDFLNNGSALDLTNIDAVRIKVGPSFGDARGRIVIDDLMLTSDGLP